MSNIIIDTVWYGSEVLTLPSPVGPIEQSIVSGAVLIWNGFNFRAYIGIGTLEDEEMDSEQISKYGNSIPHRVALAIFGNVNRTFDGKEVSLKDSYRE